MNITLTDFSIGRLFPKQKRSNTIQDCSAEAFERYLNEHAPLKVLDGYAGFCKLHVHANWTSKRCLTTGINCAPATRRATPRSCRCSRAGSKGCRRLSPIT